MNDPDGARPRRPAAPGRAAWIAVLFGLAALAAGPRASEDGAGSTLPNFHRVAEGLYRGGQPGDGGIRALARLGIRTIVDLRSADHVEEERALALDAGIRHVNVPLGRFRRPRDEEIERVLALLAAPENRPVFLHCRRGADRTGTVIACWRIRNEGWKAQAALEEAQRHGMAFWQFRMKGYIKSACGASEENDGITAAMPADGGM